MQVVRQRTNYSRNHKCVPTWLSYCKLCRETYNTCDVSAPHFCYVTPVVCDDEGDVVAESQKWIFFDLESEQSETVPGKGQRHQPVLAVTGTVRF